MQASSGKVADATDLLWAGTLSLTCASDVKTAAPSGQAKCSFIAAGFGDHTSISYGLVGDLETCVIIQVTERQEPRLVYDISPAMRTIEGICVQSNARYSVQ